MLAAAVRLNKVTSDALSTETVRLHLREFGHVLVHGAFDATPTIAGLLPDWQGHAA